MEVKLKDKPKNPDDVFDPDNGYAIIIKDLVKEFEDIKAVNGLNLKIEKGELFALLGPNGAGKTTTINILCGLLNPTSGATYVGGFNVQKEIEKVHQSIGLCPQESAVFPFLTGKENLEFFGDLYLVPKDQLKQNVERLLEDLFLTEHASRRTQKYSGGLMRRISLATALVHNPEIAFLDEPTTAMDPQSRRAVWDFIRELKKQKKTVILTTHYMEEAEELADRVGIIDYGKLIALGSPKELIQEHKVRNLEEVFLKLTGRRIREAV